MRIAGFTVAALAIVLVFAAPHTASAQLPEGYTHRPVAEFFTGLSCGPCMDGAEPIVSELWGSEGYASSRAWNIIIFHELNGGGVDELRTDESEARMFEYQPASAGTPCLIWDGGYSMQGGDEPHALLNGIDETATTAALANSGKRDIRPVKVEVKCVYNGDGSFNVMLSVMYLGGGGVLSIPGAPLPPVPNPAGGDLLNAELYVFMVEDNVTAFSDYKKDYVQCPMVFRGYAIQGEAVALEPNKWYNETAVWKMPDAENPITPFKVSAVAVVYDADDIGSQDAVYGNILGMMPRALNSIDPVGTAYDLNNKPPSISNPVAVRNKSAGVMNVSFQITDPESSGNCSAYVFYRVASESGDYVWNSNAMAFGSGGKASAIVPLDGQEFHVLAYDHEMLGSMYQASAFVYRSGAASTASTEDASLPGFDVVAILALCGVAIAIARRRN